MPEQSTKVIRILPVPSNMYMRMKKHTTILAILLFFASTAFAQKKISVDFPAWERSLQHLEIELAQASNQMARYEVNDLLLKAFNELLTTENSIKYPFDSLKTLSVLTSPDKNIRLVTWMILHDNGSCMHFGYIQAYSKTAKKYIVYPLKDHSEQIKGPESKSLTTDNWYGAYYYDLVSTKYHRQIFYTLLGWDKHNMTSQRKLIEILTLSPSGKVKFGYNIFIGDKKRIMRHIFEYSATSSMVLRYEKQTYTETVQISTSKPRKRTKKQKESFSALKRDLKPSSKTVYHSAPMIVYDNLMPIHPNAKDIYSMYVADGDSHMAYKFMQGKWRQIKTVQARNQEPKKQATPKKIDYQLLPPTPQKTDTNLRR